MRTSTTASLILAVSIFAAFTIAIPATSGVKKASGPLRPHPDNPRYFADAQGNAVYLTGSHTWSNLQDMGDNDPPAAFDYDAYLAFLDEYDHNFIRLWRWEMTVSEVGEERAYCSPQPWVRTGPDSALDGKPKFDLTRFDQAYFDRLHARVKTAGDRGVYVSVMLFEGWALHASNAPWCWNGHPFNGNNNINGIEGDTNGDGRGIEIQTMDNPATLAIEEAYVRKVIDTVNDCDNVLYEIVNESGAYSTAWQYHFIAFIKQYEAGKPKQHPVGMTFQYNRDKNTRGTNETLFASPADWISPNPDGGWRDNPPDSCGVKVILNDTDHLWGIGGDRTWVWKSFCRGLNVLFMDRYRYIPPDKEKSLQWVDYIDTKPTKDPDYEPVRLNCGYTNRYARRMNLAKTTPCSGLSSTGFCLAEKGKAYLVYAPEGGAFTLDLAGSRKTFSVEWLNPETGVSSKGESIKGGDVRSFTAPFDGDAILFLTRR